MFHAWIQCYNLYSACQTLKIHKYNLPILTCISLQPITLLEEWKKILPSQQNLHDSITWTEGILIYNGMVSADNDAKKYICWRTGHPSCRTLFLLRVCSMLRFVFSQWHVGSVRVRIAGYTPRLTTWLFHVTICLFSMACRLSKRQNYRLYTYT